jgi:hypothetical protein
MDFIWDNNHNLVRKTAWWADGLPDGQPSKTQVRMVMVTSGMRREVLAVGFVSQLPRNTRCEAR